MSETTAPQDKQAVAGKPLRVALLGSGLFATNAHAPILRSKSATFQCCAVWSRRLEAAQALADTFCAEGGDCEPCEAFDGAKGLEVILARDDIDAVIMALPLDAQPGFVTQALDAGKHVFSEKPIAPTVEIGKILLHAYQTKYIPRGLVWAIGENFRYEPGLIYASEAVARIVGCPLLMNLTVHSPFVPTNKYLNTQWRANPSWRGGLFVDAFVHSAAGLRLVAPTPPTSVSAITSSNAEHIPDIDTMAAHVRFQDGCLGVINVTYASKEGKFDLDVTGTDGRVLVTRMFGKRHGYRVVVTRKGETDVEETVKEFSFGGIDAEFLAFAETCAQIKLVETSATKDFAPKEETGIELDSRGTPEEALADLAFVEACLESGSAGGDLRRVFSHA